MKNGYSSADLAWNDCVKGGVGLTLPAGVTPKALVYEGGNAGYRTSARFNVAP